MYKFLIEHVNEKHIMVTFAIIMIYGYVTILDNPICVHTHVKVWNYWLRRGTSNTRVHKKRNIVSTCDFSTLLCSI